MFVGWVNEPVKWVKSWIRSQFPKGYPKDPWIRASGIKWINQFGKHYFIDSQTCVYIRISWRAGKYNLLGLPYPSPCLRQGTEFLTSSEVVKVMLVLLEVHVDNPCCICVPIGVIHVVYWKVWEALQKGKLFKS